MDRLLRHANILKKQQELKWNWTWDYVARCISLPATRCINRSQANSAERNGWLQVTVSIVRSHHSKGENHNCWRFCFYLKFKYLYQGTGHVYSTSIHWFLTSYSSHCHKWLHHTSRCLKTISWLKMFPWYLNGNKFVSTQTTQITSGCISLITVCSAYARAKETRIIGIKMPKRQFHLWWACLMFTYLLQCYATSSLST